MNKNRLIPIFTTSGETGAYLMYPYIYNRLGEWVGWVTKSREVYSVKGRYVGYLAKGPRILRKRSLSSYRTEQTPPVKPPGRINVPVMGPLAPLMPELSFAEIDVLGDEPERLHTLDMGELRDDMD